MLFVLNQFIAVSHSFCKILHILFLKVLSNRYFSHILCSHYKVFKFRKKKKKWVIYKKINEAGPRIDPWGTPDKSIWKKLSVSFILTLCFLRLKYE